MVQSKCRFCLGSSANGGLERGLEGRVHHPSPPEEAKNGSLLSLPEPAVETLAEEEKPPPKLSQAPKSFWNSDLEAVRQARGSPRAMQSGPSFSRRLSLPSPVSVSPSRASGKPPRHRPAFSGTSGGPEVGHGVRPMSGTHLERWLFPIPSSPFGSSALSYDHA